MTPEQRARVAEQYARGMGVDCGAPMRMDGRPITIAGVPRTLCPGRLRTTGIFPPGGMPMVVIRCSICDTWRPEDDA